MARFSVQAAVDEARLQLAAGHAVPGILGSLVSAVDEQGNRWVQRLVIVEHSSTAGLAVCCLFVCWVVQSVQVPWWNLANKLLLTMLSTLLTRLLLLPPPPALLSMPLK